MLQRLNQLSALTLSTCLLVAGCATPGQLAQIDGVVCQGEAVCAAAWRRAQVWVAQNNEWKIQTATDAVIETFNGTKYSATRSYRVVRIPLDGQREEIVLSSTCQNIYACLRDPADIARSFRAFVAATS